VVFQAPNSATLLAGIYGALLSGLAPIVISEKLNGRETREILSGLPESMIITEARLAEFARARESETDALSEKFGCRPIHFTSGTSGKPKGVWSGWLSNADADALAKEERDAWGLSRSDVHLVSGPLSHSAPLRFALNTLLNGGQVVVPARFEHSVISGIAAKWIRDHFVHGASTYATTLGCRASRQNVASPPGSRWIAVSRSTTSRRH
jgi:long-chain acyl-CoA synthetase